MLSSFTSEPGMTWPKSISREKRRVQVMENLRYKGATAGAGQRVA